MRGAPLHRLQVELAEVAPQFARAMSDVSQFGMAKSLFSSMAADGIGLDDPAAVERWIAGFNARPFERAALTDGVAPAADVPAKPAAVLPAVTLAPMDELSPAAAAAPLVQRLAALLARVGLKGLAVTSTGALRLVDAKALASVCGDEERLHRPAHLQRDVRRMANLPGVAGRTSWRCSPACWTSPRPVSDGTRTLRLLAMSCARGGSRRRRARDGRLRRRRTRACRTWWMP